MRRHAAPALLAFLLSPLLAHCGLVASGLLESFDGGSGRDGAVWEHDGGFVSIDSGPGPRPDGTSVDAGGHGEATHESGTSEAAPLETGGADGGPEGDAVADAGQGTDSGGDSGGGVINCACAGGQRCCANVASMTATCSSTCPADDVIACKQPTDCTGQTPTCCATVTFAMTGDNCGAQSLSTTCTGESACASNLELTCGTDTIPLCSAATATECADGTTCCELPGMGQYMGCVNSALAADFGLTCD